MPRAALVRGVPDSFAECLTLEEKLSPIDVSKARLQHAAYVEALKGLVGNVVELPADDTCPDCPFVEDTAVVIRDRAFITRPGAPERRGEVPAVAQALRGLGLQTTEATSPARIDGGDVLHLDDHIFVGLSSRTDEAGVAALAAAFPECTTHAVPLPSGGLHLKSFISRVQRDVVAVESKEEYLAVYNMVRRHLPHFRSLEVPDAGAANTCLVGDTLLFPSAYSEQSVSTYDSACRPCIPLDMSEFHKADGGLSCLSIIID